MERTRPPDTAARWRRIYAAVAGIPRGKVATYGQVARLAGMPGRARLVGHALGALPEGSGVPWQRVVNHRGGISPRAYPGAVEGQRSALAREGVRVGRDGRVPLGRYRWSRGAEEAATKTRKRTLNLYNFNRA